MIRSVARRGAVQNTAAAPFARGQRTDTDAAGQLKRELQEISRRLVDASERERTRLARELHDDVAQRLALISTGLSQLRRQLAGSSDDIQKRVSDLSQAAMDVCAELHRVSHQLHPARLEQLGLEAAVRSVCGDIAAASGVLVRIDVSGVPAAIDRDLALCIYRVAQEALQNVVKHSGASRATVTLTRTNGDLAIRVADPGIGFAMDEAGGRDSLGLTSMRERARLVGGVLRVASRPGYGTTIELIVPIGGAVAAMKSAG
jgi:signal transduction histidine kinase